MPINDFPASPDAFTVTFAANQKPNAPTISITAQTEAVLELRLQALETNGTLATIARTATAFGAQFNVGDILGGKMEVSELQSTPVEAPPVAHAPEQAALPDPATDAAAFALNQQRQAGMPAAPFDNSIPAQQLPGQTALPAPAPSPFAQQPVTQAGPPQQHAAYTAQPGALPGQTGVDQQGKPLGPWLPGLQGPAVFVTGVGRSGEWRAWADPRGQQVTQNIHVATARPDDPAIVAGHAKFWDWIR